MIHRKKLSFAKVCFLLIFGVVVYNEWLVYVFYSWSWPYMKCGDYKEFYKILLIADPQILGEQTESWIARWDSDRYLFKSFSRAVHHVKPDLIVFLGDLMDEGSMASPDEYVRYVDRFSKIFMLDTFHPNMTIFLPGDNDIGGENEDITLFKVSRFKKHFDQPDIWNLGRIQFIKVNKLEYHYPKLKPDKNKGTDNIRVLVSHIPLLGLPSWFSAEAIMNLQPKMIFSAHDHKSVHFAGDLKTGERTLVEPLIVNHWSYDWPMTWRFQLFNHIVNEVVVPTCSYRMGTLQMGYGAAVIDKNGETLCYSVLKLPSRLVLLLLYVVLIILCALMACCLRSNCKKYFVIHNRRLF